MSVYSFGSGKEGQLGQGTNIDHLDPIVVSGLKGKRIERVACGEYHSLAITEFGDLYSWGRGKEGQLGHGDRNSTPIPSLVKALSHERIVQAQCGSYHSIALTDTGKVYIWGKIHRNDLSQKGTGNQYFGVGVGMVGLRMESDMLDRSFREYLSAGMDKDNEQVQMGIEFERFVNIFQSLPLLVEGALKGRRCVYVAAGYGFSVALTDTGRAYTWGFNEKGQLGLGHRFNMDSPTLVHTLEKQNARIVQVACGSQHVLFLTDTGDIYSCGLGVFGQLGHGELDDLLYPKKTPQLGPAVNLTMVQVACGAYFSVGRTSDGVVYSWGHGEYGQHGGSANYQDWGSGLQAGKGTNLHNSFPRPVGGLEGFVTHISCGQLHTVAITETNNVFTWGWGSSGCLGHGDRRFHLIPKLVLSLQGDEISHASCGWKHTLIVKSGNVSTFAFDFKPLLGDSKYSDLTFIVQNKPIHAHRVVVFARCPMLKVQILMQARFRNGGKMTKEFVIQGIRHPIFTGLLLYLYTDHLILPPHLCRELAVVAKTYSLPRLEAMCLRAASKRAVEGDNRIFIPPSTLASDMKSVVGDPVYSAQDQLITFELDTESIPAHKAILASRCKYFERMFEGGFKEKLQSVFKLEEGTEAAAFLCLLDFLYSGDDKIVDENNAVDLLGLSDRFMVEDLKQQCESFLESLVSEAITTINQFKEQNEKEKDVNENEATPSFSVDAPLSPESDCSSPRPPRADITSSDLTESIENITSLLEVGDRFGAPRLKRVCMEAVCGLSDEELWKLALSLRSFEDLKYNAPHLIEELNHYATENNLIIPAELTVS